MLSGILLRRAGAFCGPGAALPALRLFSSSTSQRDTIAKALATPEITQLLQEAGVDFRDCFERSELVDKLDKSFPFLPSHVRNRLAALLAERQQAGGASRAAPGPAAVPSPPEPASGRQHTRRTLPGAHTDNRTSLQRHRQRLKRCLLLMDVYTHA